MARRSRSRSSVERLSNAETQPSETSQLLASIDLDIATRLEHDERFRERYLRTWAANEVATELRTMRKRRVLRQEDLAAQVGTGQSAISRIEKRDYDGWTFKTLLNIAGTLRARLRIKLEPLEDVIQRQANQTIRLEEKNVREMLDNIESNHGRMASILEQRTQIAQAVIKELFREAQTKDATYAVGCGIIHEIRDLQIPAGSTVISLVFQR